MPGLTVGLVAPVGTLAAAAHIEDCADAHDPPNGMLGNVACVLLEPKSVQHYLDQDVLNN